MDRLANAVELLDGPLDDLTALAGNLRDLRRVNRLLGGSSLSIRALERLVERDPVLSRPALAVLDVGTGAGDIPLDFLDWAGRHGLDCQVTAVDERTEVIDAARRVDPGLGTRPGLELIAADGRCLPFPDASFDIGHASMVLHHLEPSDAVGFLGELRRVSRIGVIVNDLQRGRLQWLGAWILAHLATRNRLTRHDAPLSVRRAYTAAEVGLLLERAGLRPIAEFRGLVGHRFAIAAIPEPGSLSESPR